MAERTDAEQTEKLFHMDYGLCVFTMKPVLLTAFEKNSEADRQIIGLMGNQSADMTYLTMEFDYFNFLIGRP